MPITEERPLPADLVEGRMLSMRETMGYLGVSKRALIEMSTKWHPDHRVPSYKYKKLRKFKKSELDWWIEKHRVPV